MTDSKEVIIIGGGAAGFFAAINMAESNPHLKVTILEKSGKVLQKVKVSGGGRCNVTHACFDPKELIEYYPRGKKELLGPFHTFMTGDTIEWFEDRGIPLKIEDDMRMFPESNSSQTILDCFIEIAPSPQPKKAEERLVDSKEEKMTGFVFKIHANMDPKHRDRLAFIKIVSGTFKRNSPYLHVRNGKKVKFSSPNAFFAEKKEIVDESFPGDIVGIHDTGSFKIGDTLTEGEKLNFKGIPSFSPEHFRYVNNADPMKSKQLFKGLDQLMDEGVAQLFTLGINGRKIIGTVGALQYEVIQYRLEHEYGAKCSYENIHVHKACWIEAEDDKSDEFKEFKRVKQRYLAKDKQGQLVFLADSAFTIQMTQSKYPTVKLHFTSEFQ